MSNIDIEKQMHQKMDAVQMFLENAYTNRDQLHQQLLIVDEEIKLAEKDKMRLSRAIDCVNGGDETSPAPEVSAFESEIAHEEKARVWEFSRDTDSGRVNGINIGVVSPNAYHPKM